MKCPDCGAWTEVLETRDAHRRRECANGHRFSTVEILTLNIARRSKAIADAVVLKKMTLMEAAEMFCLRSDAYVSRCVKKYYPQYCGRSAGQRRRFERERSREGIK